MTRVSVVIPTYNHYQTLVKTLQSLDQQSLQDFEVIVSDDGSQDQTSDVQKNNYKFSLKYIYQKNNGRAAARNHGIANTSGDIIVFIDDHILLDKDFLTEHLDFHLKYFDQGIEIVRGGVGYIKDEADIAEVMIKEKVRSESNPFVTFITNNVSVRRRALLFSGGFDEDFKEYGFQDSELGYRLKKMGFKTKYNPKAIGYIFSVNNPIEKRLDRFRQAGRSAVLFAKKHRWGNILLGAHFLNLWKLKILTAGDLLPQYHRRRMTANNKHFFKLRQIYYLQGIKDGFQKYDRSYSAKKADNIVFIVLHQLDLSGAPISSILLANNLQNYLPVIIAPEMGEAVKRIDQNKVLVRKVGKIFKRLKLGSWQKVFQPIIVHCNTFLTEYALNIAEAKKIAHIREDLSIYPRIAARIAKKADQVIVISQGMKNYFPIEQQTKISVVHNALESFPEPKDLEEESYILFIGSIEKRKGLEYLLEAVKEVDIKVKVLGRVLEPGYYRRIKKICPDKVQFLKPMNDISDQYRRAKMVVVPSLSEPFGRVVLEAISFGKVVIGSDVGGIPEIIEHDHSGYLVPPADSQALKRKINQVLELTPEKLAEIKQNARKRSTQFSAEKHVDRIEQIYKN